MSWGKAVYPVWGKTPDPHPSPKSIDSRLF